MDRRSMMAGGGSMALAAAMPRQAQGAEAAVVLELFTSQGCSSCPPADALLGELGKRPGVIALAWHIDYWNNLGWRDPFASRQSTERQRGYARHLRDEVYTPAMVVNGAAMMVGSDRYAVHAAIRQAKPLPVSVTLRRAGSGVEVEIGDMAEPMSAVLAIYDSDQVTNVQAGENSGRRLREFRIVREVRTLDAIAGRLVLADVPQAQGAAFLLQDAAWRVRGAADLRPV